MYVKPIEQVREVTETTSVDVLNALIKDGWMLLQAATSNGITLYGLGKIAEA